MEEKLDEIINRLQAIELDIKYIRQDINQIKQQTSKMDSHVDFINGVYEKVEAPLNFVTSKFHTLVGSEPNRSIKETDHQ